MGRLVDGVGGWWERSFLGAVDSVVLALVVLFMPAAHDEECMSENGKLRMRACGIVRVEEDQRWATYAGIKISLQGLEKKATAICEGEKRG